MDHKFLKNNVIVYNNHIEKKQAALKLRLINKTKN